MTSSSKQRKTRSGKSFKKRRRSLSEALAKIGILLKLTLEASKRGAQTWTRARTRIIRPTTGKKGAPRPRILTRMLIST